MFRNTGNPQGCVLSPFLLHSLYEWLSESIYYYSLFNMQMHILWAILALLKNSDNYFLDYQRSITYFSTWCDDNFLPLNISKNKELFFGFSKTQIHPSIGINGEMVERVEHFRYLGITLDDHLSLNQHILGVYKAFQQRRTVLRILSSCLFGPAPPVSEYYWASSYIWCLLFCFLNAYSS